MCSLLHCIDRQSVSVFHKVFLCFRMPRQGLSNDIMKGFHLQPYQSVDVFFLLSPYQKGRFALHNLHRNSDGKQEKQPLETRHHGKQWWSTSSQTTKASGLSTDSTHPVFSRKITRKTHKTHATYYMSLIWQRKPQLYDLYYVTKTVEKMEMVKNSTNRIFFVANFHQNWHPTSDTNPRYKQFHTWRMDQQPKPSSSTKMTSLRARTTKK